MQNEAKKITMTKKMISWLSFMVVFVFLLNSCVHDEIYSASNPEEYHSKSLWKEDEIYFKNIIKIYEEHENEIRKEHGVILWEDYTGISILCTIKKKQ